MKDYERYYIIGNTYYHLGEHIFRNTIDILNLRYIIVIILNLLKINEKRSYSDTVIECVFIRYVRY